jgi:hypothetical protein
MMFPRAGSCICSSLTDLLQLARVDGTQGTSQLPDQSAKVAHRSDYQPIRESKSALCFRLVVGTGGGEEQTQCGFRPGRLPNVVNGLHNV